MMLCQCQILPLVPEVFFLLSSGEPGVRDKSQYAYVGGNPLSYSDPDETNPMILYRGFMFGYRLGEAINPFVQPYIASAIDAWVLPDSGLSFAKPGNQSRPSDAPTGTLPIDGVGLSSGDVHGIKGPLVV